MLLWLPLFSGNALAVSLSMQMQQGQGNETEMAQMDMAMPQDGMDDMMMSGMQDHCTMDSAAGQHHGTTCSDCGLCHLGSAGYVAVTGIAPPAMQNAARENTPYLVAFQSFTSAPLVPPPLARA